MDIHIEGRNLEILPEWRQKIEEELTRLQDHYLSPILHARVIIIGTPHHHLGTFEVHLMISVSGDTITIIQKGEFVRSLLVDAFNALDRRLLEHSRILQQEVKTHEEHSQNGEVIRLFPDEGYGFIGDQDGVEVYFHANALKKGKIKQLKVGSPVKFAPEEGDKGLQAVWVEPL
jgi:cold shock CspA family protein/ribosome-associated translation inhibitor RaiA